MALKPSRASDTAVGCGCHRQCVERCRPHLRGRVTCAAARICVDGLRAPPLSPRADQTRHCCDEQPRHAAVTVAVRRHRRLVRLAGTMDTGRSMPCVSLPWASPWTVSIVPSGPGVRSIRVHVTGRCLVRVNWSPPSLWCLDVACCARQPPSDATP